MSFKDDQINKLRSLGIEVGMGVVSSKQSLNLSGKRGNSMWLLVPVFGLGLFGFGGLMLLKNNNEVGDYIEIKQTDGSVIARISPTRSSGSVQQHLLASQQYFSQALTAQGTGDNSEIVELLNMSIAEISKAIESFPQDYRVYQQRGRIYQSLIGTNTNLSDQDKQFLNQAIADLTRAYQINSDSVEVNRSLASLYARSGDVDNTLYYLSETIRIEPTKAQNFYDLAKIQSQSGDVASALETYKQLIWLVSDSSQKETLEKEKAALEKILADNPDLKAKKHSQPVSKPTNTIERDGPKIQASNKDGLIVALAEEANKVEVEGMTQSNSFSGTAKLSSGQTDTEISNENVDEDSLIYVSAIRGGKNQALRIKSKSSKSFRVGLDIPSTETIEFKWWIVK